MYWITVAAMHRHQSGQNSAIGCHSNSGKSDHHDPDRDDCKDFGGTSHPHWCIATPAVSINDESQVVEDLRSDLEQLEIKLQEDKDRAVEIEIARENEINELRAYTDCLEGKMSGVTGTVRGRKLIAMINNCKEMHPSLE